MKNIIKAKRGDIMIKRQNPICNEASIMIIKDGRLLYFGQIKNMKKEMVNKELDLLLSLNAKRVTYDSKFKLMIIGC